MSLTKKPVFEKHEIFIFNTEMKWEEGWGMGSKYKGSVSLFMSMVAVPVEKYFH